MGLRGTFTAAYVAPFLCPSGTLYQLTRKSETLGSLGHLPRPPAYFFLFSPTAKLTYSCVSVTLFLSLQEANRGEDKQLNGKEELR